MKVSELKQWAKDARKHPDFLGFTQDFVDNSYKPFARYAKVVAKTPEDNTSIKDIFNNFPNSFLDFKAGLANTTTRNYLRIMLDTISTLDDVKSLFTQGERDHIVKTLEPLIKEADAMVNEEAKQRKAAELDNTSITSLEDVPKPKKKEATINKQVHVLQQHFDEQDTIHKKLDDSQLRLDEALKENKSLQEKLDSVRHDINIIQQNTQLLLNETLNENKRLHNTIDDLLQRLLVAQTSVGKAEALQMQVDKLWQLVLNKPACT